MHNCVLDEINVFAYPCFSVSAEVAAALMVCYTCHHQTSLPASNVILLPLLGAPLLHYASPAIGIRDAPIRSHLQDTKYMHDILEDKIKPS
jgi:hypothetical protein